MSDRERDTKDIEARLRISEERLRLAETASGIGMFELDLVSDRWEWTPHVAVLFGLDSRIPGVLFADWERAPLHWRGRMTHIEVEQSGLEHIFDYEDGLSIGLRNGQRDD